MSENNRVRVAVVFGGRSGEHSISCATAAGVLREIDRERFDVIPIGITRDGQWVSAPDDPAAIEGGLAEVPSAEESVSVTFDQGSGRLAITSPGQVPRDLDEVDVVFPLLHGPFGEDGTIQGLFEMGAVRYVGSGVLSSAVGMDKHYMKVALAAAGLPIAPYVIATPRLWRTDPATILDAVAALHFPVFVKPARAGSSLGISRVERLEDVPAAIEAAQIHDPRVLIEDGMPGREIECGVLQGRGDGPPRTAPLGEIIVDRDQAEFYDYETKYFSPDGAALACPADLPDEAVAEMQALAARAFEALCCEGLARVDFFWDPGHGAVINEVNTMPGFTPISMFPTMWSVAGMPYPELLTELIELAMERPLGLR
ncbi:MAG TPA: D-alanine--D-alanine ligase family protein [Actinomycetaceae bacterium]|nr:D-alanine--D-alanine ligase family protein [Actinomycetaceae bacterium]